jgi:hypothetical protein
MSVNHVCEVDGCDKPAPRTKMCDMHRKRVSREGRPGEAAPRIIQRGPITEAERAVILDAAGKMRLGELAATMHRDRRTLLRVAREAGVSLRHDRPGRPVLDVEMVSQIKRRLAEGESCPSIAEDYPCLPGAIWAIKAGQNWKDVEPEGAEENAAARGPKSDSRVTIQHEPDSDAVGQEAEAEGESPGDRAARNTPAVEVERGQELAAAAHPVHTDTGR